MSEEKEQLEQTSLKVKSDLDSMKAKYQDMVSTIKSLIADPSLSPSRKDLPTGPDSGGDLGEGSVAQLKRLKQLDTAELEKTDTKLRAKLAELDRSKQELQQRIRYSLAIGCGYVNNVIPETGREKRKMLK